MKKLFDNLNTGVIIACDVTTPENLYKLVNETTDVDGIVGYKVGFMLGTGFGLKNIIPETRKYTSKTIIYDHQKAGTDIPAMGKNFANLMKDSEVDAAIIFPQAGPETQIKFIEGLVEKEIIPIGGGEMTHPKYLDKDGGYIRDSAPNDMYTLSLEKGVKDFVVPGNKPEAIKKYIDGPFKKYKDKIALHSPGHGKQGGILSDAIIAAYPVRYFGIVGGGIYKQDNLYIAAEKWANEAITIRDKLETKLGE